ncbi:hypothetical protein BJX62DRAFT_235435 [Aspergillus germanicus]
MVAQWSEGRSTAHDIWVGHVLAGPMPRVQDAMAAKYVLEQFIVKAGNRTKTADVTVGYHLGREQWMLFGRLRMPEYMIGYPDDVEGMPGSVMRDEHRAALCPGFGHAVPDLKGNLKLFDPSANKGRYYAAIAELEPTSVSHVMLYQWIPFLLKKDSKVQRHDYNTYKAMLYLELGGLGKVMDRLKSEEDEADQGSAKDSE